MVRAQQRPERKRARRPTCAGASKRAPSEPGRTERGIKFACAFKCFHRASDIVSRKKHEAAKGLGGSKTGRVLKCELEFGQGRAVVFEREFQFRDSRVSGTKIGRQFSGATSGGERIVEFGAGLQRVTARKKLAAGSRHGRQRWFIFHNTNQFAKGIGRR